MGPADGSPGHSRGCVGISTECWTYGFKLIGTKSVCDIVAPHVNRGVAFGVRSRTFSFPGGRRGGPSATGTACLHPDGGHGFVAPTGEVK